MKMADRIGIGRLLMLGREANELTHDGLGQTYKTSRFFLHGELQYTLSRNNSSLRSFLGHLERTSTQILIPSPSIIMQFLVIAFAALAAAGPAIKLRAPISLCPALDSEFIFNRGLNKVTDTVF